MPRSQREYMIRRTEQIKGALDRALYHLGEMRKAYHPNYPEHVKAVEAIAFMIVQVRDLVEQFRKEKV